MLVSGVVLFFLQLRVFVGFLGVQYPIRVFVHIHLGMTDANKNTVALERLIRLSTFMWSKLMLLIYCIILT